jgi:hypothetical protein
MQTINAQIKNIDELIASAEEGKLEEYRAEKKRLEEEAAALKKSFGQNKEEISLQSAVQNITALTGGLASLGAGIQQVQNLGSIWKNSDLTTGEKLLQTITNLSMSIPMLINGLSKVTTTLGLVETMTNAEAVAAGYSTSAEAAHAVSLRMVDGAAGAATIKIQLLNTTIMLNPFVAVAAAAIAFATALGAVAKAAEEARKASLENSQAIIQE